MEPLPNQALIEHKRILITGGTGSFGRQILQRIMALNPDRVRVLSRDEKKQNDMALEYISDPRVSFLVGDVRDIERVQEATSDTDIVIHAAALKQVPSCEFGPLEAVKTNILGAGNVRTAAIRNKVGVVLSISTDKAVKPVNVMGMTKAIQERLMLNVSPRDTTTRFVCVRFGNVLGSRGSVIPIFLNRIKNRLPLPVTNPAMTRFLLTMDAAVDLVLMAIEKGANGELWVKKLPAADLMTLAMATGYGATGNDKYPIEVLGSRPGEKLHEILVSEEEMWRATDQGDYYSLPRWTGLIDQGGPKADTISEFDSLNTKQLGFDDVLTMLRNDGWLTKPECGIGPKMEGA